MPSGYNLKDLPAAARDLLRSRLEGDMETVAWNLVRAQEERVVRQYQGRAQYIEILLKELD